MRFSRLPAVLDAVYGAAADGAAWPAALASVADAVGGSGAMLVRHPAGGQGGFQLISGLREDLSALYMERYTANPYAAALAHVRPGRAVAVNALVDVAVVRRTAFHADILAPQGIAGLVNTVHPAFVGHGATGGLGVTLTTREAEDTVGAVRRLDRLSPHFVRAVTLSMHLAREASRYLAAGLDLMPGAALLLDGDARVRHANPPAEALLRREDGLCADAAGQLHLPAALPGEAAALGRMMERAIRLSHGEPTAPAPAIRLSRPSGLPPLVVVAVGLPPGPFAAWSEAGVARVIVFVGDPAAPPPHAAADLLRMAVGLTAAEAEVGALVAGGAGVPGAATALGVAPATAKSHLARVFAKAAVTSQAELVRLVSGLPGALPPAVPAPPPATSAGSERDDRSRRPSPRRPSGP